MWTDSFPTTAFVDGLGMKMFDGEDGSDAWYYVSWGQNI